MTWQDERQRLEEQRAAGRLSEDDYQRRRAELSALAGDEPGDRPAHDTPTGPASPGPATQGPDSTPGPQVPGPQVPGQDVGDSPPSSASPSPFPPAFRWDTMPHEETTEVINPVGAEDPDRTQIVPDRQPPPPSYHDTESIQVVQAGPLSPLFGEPSPPPRGLFDDGSAPGPGWTAQGPGWTAQGSAPPWASSDPLREPDAGWAAQGPEFFEPAPKEASSTRIVAMVAAVVVLAVIAFGTWFLWGRESPPVAAGGQTGQQPAGTAAQEPADPLAPAPVDGIEEDKDVTSFSDLAGVGFLTGQELTTLEEAGAAQSRLLITNGPRGKATILVSEVDSRTQAVAARDELTDLQIGYGFVTRTAPRGVTSVELLDRPGRGPTLRAVYASGAQVVRIEMLGNDPAEATMTARAFEQILDQQLEKFPVDA